MTIKRFLSSVIAVARREMLRIGSNAEYRAVLLWLPLGVILFFALFFSQEVVGALPIAVVDEDNSALSRRLVTMIRATPQVAITEEVADMARAREKLLQGDVVGVVEIPNGFEKLILSGESGKVVFYDSGANISTSSLASKSVQTVVTTFGVGVAVQRVEMEGVISQEALAQAMPILFTTYGLFNPWLNYAYYVAPCFCVMILIIASMLSTLYAVGVELRYATSLEWLRTANGSLLAALLGKLSLPTLAIWLLALVIGMVIFALFGAPMQGSWLMLAIGTISLVAAYQAVAIFVIALTASLRLSLSIGGGYSVLAFTFSGITFPTMAMFSWIQPVTMLFPYTYFMRLYIDQAVRGSSWWLSMQDLAAMLLFCMLPILSLGRLKQIVVKRKFWCRL